MPETYSDVEIRIQQAVDAFYEREVVSIPALAREFVVPEQRLRARCNGRRSYLTRPGGNRRLSLIQEKAICEYLDRLDHIGTAARHHMLKNCANSILAANHSSEATPAPTVGPKWANRFLSRHPEYFVRRQKTIDVNRKVAHNAESITEWLGRFQDVIKEKGTTARDCYNMDETRFRIGMGRDQWVLTKDKHRPSFMPSSTNRESVTVVETISGDGEVLPPFVIMSGVLQQEIWFTQTNLDDDCMVAVSETGFSNDRLSYDWLKRFDRYSTPRLAGVYRLLLLDGYGSHCTYEFITYCDERKIIPFCMPPHATHLLQPLDVVLFQPYKHWHTEAVDDATRTGCIDFNKVEFLSALRTMRQRTFKRTSILSGFRRTGLIPYDPEVVLSKMRETQPFRPSTPEEPSSSADWPHIFNTPLTIRTLHRQADILQSKDIPTPTRRDLGKFIKGSLTIATTGQLMTEQVERSQAAENARKLRQRQNRRVVQKGGVIYAKDARHIAQERYTDELKATRARLARLEQAAVKKRLRRVRQVVWDRVKGKLPNRTQFIEDLDSKMALVCAEMLERVEEGEGDEDSIV